MTAHPLRAVQVAPGLAGLHAVRTALADRLNGDGPAFAMVPSPSRHITQGYIDLVRAAVQPTESDGPLGQGEQAPDPGPPLEDPDTAVVVATSGSTGAPRGVLITAANLHAAAEASFVQRPGLRECAWVLALPVTSAGGFGAMARSYLAGTPLHAMASIGGQAPFRVEDLLALPVTEPFAISLVPTQLVDILDSPDATAWLARAHTVLVGAAATPAQVITQARDAGIAIVTTYGMTETSGGCVYDGQPLPGMAIDIASDGLISLSGPMIAAGYRSQSGQSDDSFSGSAPQRRFRTRDHGEWRDGRLHVIGRIDDVVTVHGVNVSLGAIESLIRSELGVRDVAVVAVDDARQGHRLTAFLVTDADASKPAKRGGSADPTAGPVATAITGLIIERLGRAAQPQIVQVAELPYLPNGKIDRLALSESDQAR